MNADLLIKGIIILLQLPKAEPCDLPRRKREVSFLHWRQVLRVKKVFLFCLLPNTSYLIEQKNSVLEEHLIHVSVCGVVRKDWFILRLLRSRASLRPHRPNAVGIGRRRSRNALVLSLFEEFLDLRRRESRDDTHREIHALPAIRQRQQQRKAQRNAIPDQKSFPGKKKIQKTAKPGSPAKKNNDRLFPVNAAMQQLLQ